jgi:3alpha(or 20beta)-hydroxysteroid dehydrogenase
VNAAPSALAGQIAIVTGGASGLGRAIAERFATEGAQVLIADIDASNGIELAKRIGPRAMFAHLDVTQSDDWQAALHRVAESFGQLTCLVNNAGINIAGSIADITQAAWRRTLDVNATGTFLGCKHAVEAMRETGGTIINIASARARRPSGGQVAYCASKALVLTLTESVAISCGEQGWNIRCNAICPGVFDTPILDGMRVAMGGTENMHAALARLHLNGRLGKPEELAAMAVYLASDAASFITGASFTIDGGFSIRDK